MFKNVPAFSGFSVDNLEVASRFYEHTLGLVVESIDEGLTIKVAHSNGIFVYEKPDHQPATYTVLNFPVASVDEVVKQLKAKGVEFEHYEGMTGSDNIARGKEAGQGPDIAWFKDPAGNVLAVLSN